MIVDEKIFLERYEKLNERQKDAVDTIYGPVMVIAGPGTGKTEVLSMRIAGLLRSEAQVQPNEILCLTYTDEASNAMRRRLTQVIGAAAHRVSINTFHSFCNNVIQNNSEHFSQRSLQPITELERTELLYQILEELPPGHALRKLSGNIYLDAGKLNRLFDMMKRENLRCKDISEAINEYIIDLPARDEYIYKKAGKDYKKGDPKQKLIDEEIKRMQTTLAAAELFDLYTDKMKETGRYDFNDMIIWVLDAFKTNAALLQSYQERHQFILVDEFQDTNGSQNELLTMLTEFWEDPNIFVVGDDDQSIYEFQGARIRNIIDFYERYKESIRIVILPHNYRSSQSILDKAAATIVNNKQRLIYQLQELQLDKDIMAAADRFKNNADDVKPVVKVYANVMQEEVDTVLQIEKLQQQGMPLSSIAILYAQHKQADNIIAMLERKGIPYNVKRPVNILDSPLIQQVLNVIRYLDEERKKPFSAEPVLFEIMHAPYFGIAPSDIAYISLYIQANKAKENIPGYWRMILNNGLFLESLGLQSAPAMRRLGNNIDQWMRHQAELPLPLLVEKIIYESGIVAHQVHSKDYMWNVQVLHTFFDYVKELHSRNPRIKPADFLRMVERMEDENIAIPALRVIQTENGVHFYTAHGAKGNEFEYVYVIGATKNFWEAKRGITNEYKLPDNITRTSEDPEKTYKTEVARRLFYVALTRAKKHLQISFAQYDNAGKGLEPSVFITEIAAGDEQMMQHVPAAELVKHMELAMQPVPETRIRLANHQQIDKVLQQFAMSYSSLSKFLRCPLAFYYETILRVPFQRNDALAFGSAVHDALERWFLDMKARKGEFPDKDYLLGAFKSGMFRESSCFTTIQFDRRMEQGNTILSEYYDRYIGGLHTNVEIEYKVPRYVLDGVPVTGKIDKIEINGDTCTVIDYKTGDPDKSGPTNLAPPNDKEPNGGDYWRQMVFYKLILENYEDRQWKVAEGIFDYIQKGGKTNEYKQWKVPMFAQDEAVVRAHLKDSYNRIMNHDFSTGCGKDDCHWCNFAKQYELVRPAIDEVVEIDDI